MNATEKAKILQNKGYTIRLSRASGYGYEIFKGRHGLCIHWNASRAKLIHEAYAKFIEAQEALEAQRAQDADDLAGKEAYEEVKAEAAEPEGYMRPCEECGGSGTCEGFIHGTLVHCGYCDGTGIHQESEDETTQLRAEIEALKAENLRYRGTLEHVIGYLVNAVNQDKTGDIQDALDAISTALDPAKLDATPAPTAQAASEVTLSDAEIDFLINNTGDTSEDYEDYTAPSYLIPDALYKKLEKLTDFTIFANHYRLAREYDTPANRGAIAARRKALGLGE